MLIKRIASAVIGIPLILLAAWFGQLPLFLLTVLIMVLAMIELTRILYRLNIKPPAWLLGTGIVILLLNTYLYRDTALSKAVTMIVVLALLTLVIFYPRYTPLDCAGALLAVLYIGLFVYFYLLRLLPDGWIWLVFMLTSTWASDTMAFFVGRKWGNRRMAPLLSPKKTIEGAIGGVMGSLLTAVIFTYIYPFLPRGEMILLGFLIAMAAQLGDLVESAFKRQAGVKDTGDLIPGHGGVLDRFDSMLFTAPLVYYFVLAVPLRLH